MDEIILSRLRLIIEQISILSDSAVTVTHDTITNENRSQAQVIASKLEKMLQRFSNELNNYFRLCNQPSAEDISDMSSTEITAEQTLAELKVKINESSGHSTNISSGETSSFGKLPKLHLPEFDGDILNWSQFWDQFNSNIHSRKLANVDKLLYLKASLKGEAWKVIEGLETTNKNYDIAVSTLRERYGKAGQVLDAHYSALYKIKKSDKTVAECRRTLGEIERHLRVLESLGEDIKHNHLRFLIMEKFPEEVIYELKMKLKNDSIEEIRKNLETIISAKEDASRISQETLNTNKEDYTVGTLHVNVQNKDRLIKGYTRTPHDKFEGQAKSTNNFHSNKRVTYKRKMSFNPKYNGPANKRTKLSCIFCKKFHFSDKCQKIKTLEDRKKALGSRCFSCFREGHSNKYCKYKRNCAHCNAYGQHNRALCPKLFANNTSEGTSSVVMHLNTQGSTALQTAVVKASREGDCNNYIQCRVLMDSGSQRSYITQGLAKRLNLPVIEENTLSIYTFGTEIAKQCQSPLVKVHLKTATNKIRTLYVNVVPIISKDIPNPTHEIIKLDNKFTLADNGSMNGQIDILIGSDYYFSLISNEKIKIKDYFYIVNSDFGWILTGKIPHIPIDQDLKILTYFMSTVEYKLDKPDLPLQNDLNVKILWDLESIGITDSPNLTREEEAIKIFNETTQIKDGRYSVRWPWKNYPPSLPTNFGLAKGRLTNLIKRMDIDTLKSYDQVIRDQLRGDIIEIVSDNDNSLPEHPIHYLPHHGVKVPGKPIRIVYDASAKTKDSKSLNECLYCGPPMTEELTSLLIRFRSYPIGLTADVEKAFLQIALQPSDRNVTRFLWLKDITKSICDDNLLILRFCRVPFGIISSPFLLNATIKHHLTHSKHDHIRKIANDIYVDNLITGTLTTKKALKLHQDSLETFNEISMNLRAWSSNSKEVMGCAQNVCKDEVIKILGLDWNTVNDTISLKFENFKQSLTKRGVLKVIASVYDPCGFTTPIMLSAKLFLQDLWKLKMKWDTPLSIEKTDEWSFITNNLEHIKEISLPRYYFKGINKKDKQEDYQLHCFTDASIKAYAAVIYIVNGNNKGFVIGKSRLTPIKDQNNLKIPRLELLGVLIGSRLIQYVLKSLHIKIKQQYLWTDSQIVIDWYNSDKLLTPFVARRIEEIKRNQNIITRYVPSELNPADTATRPNKSSNVIQIWLDGPDFITKEPNNWPTQIKTPSLFAGEVLSKAYKDLPRELMELEQEAEKLKEQESESPTGLNNIVQGKEFENIDQEIINLQTKYFPDEMAGKETNLSRNLKLFKDEHGILRCGGRMRNTDWSFDKKHPILIPKNSEFSTKLIKDVHEKNYHVGVSHTLHLIRQKYWLIHGRSQVQKVLRRCPRCIKHGGGPYRLPTTPDLPPHRVRYEAPFAYTGLDYFGPMMTKGEKGMEKRWICLFTCLVVRSVHLEVVRDLTAEECLLAIRRFIATRGTPSLFLSDNASQFKLTAEVMCNQYCIKNKINWKFIPELAPWHGGMYERLVGVAKGCLKRTLEKHRLNDSQLATVIKEVETVINTRPLTAVGSEQEHVLTPADFLSLGKCITVEPSEKLHTIPAGSSTKQNLISSWKRGLMIIEEFKDMFVNRYLVSLRERYNYSPKQSRIVSNKIPRVGDLVQLKGDSKNRENWKIGKIISLEKGADGLCRTARVCTEDKNVGNDETKIHEYTRSISHLYPLEIDEQQENATTSSDEKSGTNENDDEIADMVSEGIDIVSDCVNNEQDRISDEENIHTQRSEPIKPKRAAAKQALEKMRAWTRELFRH